MTYSLQEDAEKLMRVTNNCRNQLLLKFLFLFELLTSSRSIPKKIISFLNLIKIPKRQVN